MIFFGNLPSQRTNTKVFIYPLSPNPSFPVTTCHCVSHYAGMVILQHFFLSFFKAPWFGEKKLQSL